MTKAAAGAHSALPESYEELCLQLHFPRPVRDNVDYENFVEVIDLLTSRAELTKDQEDYLDALSTFVEKHETKVFPAKSRASQTEIIAFLLESNGLTPADLSKILGDESRSLGTRLLSGERELSKAHIGMLCKRFGVRADLFLPSD